jgi:hypothetical protein
MEGMCGVGKWLLKWQDRDTDECPHCSAPEDARHMWQCLAVSTIPIRSWGMEHLDQWMQSSLTSPDIRLVINTRLSQLFQCQPITPIPSILADMQAALAIQDDIGWEISLRAALPRHGKRLRLLTIGGVNLGNPVGTGLFHLFKNCGTLHGTCGNTGLA